ncbi:hypothetical protein CC78DRAFT_616031 [Lojkania enalia]|uniref:BTB domain-containing protein n=1 Tax=Lojkania enalia TaxID=147567 RepID=A0A9P4K9R1_9PLEO|nr:hypothetical protein CC78DRAFT_616031 [Didymosphaeria enalia]
MNQPEDVEIILSHDRHYQFHSSVLARNSLLLADMLSERNAVPFSNKAKAAKIKIRWTIELTSIEGHGTLERLELNNEGKPIVRTQGIGLILNENGRIPTKMFDYYESILYSFYGKNVAISDDNIHAALLDAVAIIEIAEYLRCVPVISKPVDVALVKHGQELFKYIARQPYLWAQMAHRIKSELIFKEALIHLAGNWNVYKDDKIAQDAISNVPGLRDICEKHHVKLDGRRERMELAIISLYPGTLAAPSEDRPIRREEYSKDILVWMALTFFRHWFGQRIIVRKGGQASDGGYELYKALGTAGEAYMDKSILNQLHLKFPLTKKAMNVLENHLLEIKQCIKGLVEHHRILKNESQLDMQKHPELVNYLTCVDVQREDFPWLAQKDGTVNGSGKNGSEMIRRTMAANRAPAQFSEQSRAAYGASDDYYGGDGGSVAQGTYDNHYSAKADGSTDVSPRKRIRQVDEQHLFRQVERY